MFLPNRRRDPYYHRNMYRAYRNQRLPNPRQNNLSTMAEKGVAGFSKTLNNIQEVVNLVQTAAPIIEEYGPMIKNIPTLYKMIKIMKEPEEEITKHVGTSSEQVKEKTNTQYMASEPKLFI